MLSQKHPFFSGKDIILPGRGGAYYPSVLIEQPDLPLDKDDLLTTFGKMANIQYHLSLS